MQQHINIKSGKVHRDDNFVHLLGACGIPLGFQRDIRWKLKYAGSPEAFTACRQFVKFRGAAKKLSANLYLHGPVNSYKTFLLSMMAVRLMEYSEDVIFASLNDLVTLSLESSEQFNRKVEEPDFLFVDNVNATDNAYSAKVFARVVQIRHDAHRSLVFASQLCPEEFRSAYGGALADKIEAFIEVQLSSNPFA